MKIGFTGTQIGMTGAQKQKVMDLIDYDKPTETHSGDCIGADHDFYKLVRLYNRIARIYPKIVVIGHPPTNPSKRAFDKYDFERPLKPYLERNKDIVTESDILIAIPKELEEQLRSGTWATVRAARRQNKKVYIVYPDGGIEK